MLIHISTLHLFICFSCQRADKKNVWICPSFGKKQSWPPFDSIKFHLFRHAISLSMTCEHWHKKNEIQEEKITKLSTIVTVPDKRNQDQPAFPKVWKK
jgi:hypothetical protein